MSGGAKAGKSGLTWEAWVKSIAQGQGFEIQPYKSRAKWPVPPESRRILWTHAPYKTIYHSEKKPRKTSTEFVIECKGELARIECKWQNTSGSVDEKYPFMFLNAVVTMEEPIVVLALEGKYFKKGRGLAIHEWLKDALKNPPAWLAADVHARMKTRELHVHDFYSFQDWFLERFPA